MATKVTSVASAPSAPRHSKTAQIQAERLRALARAGRLDRDDLRNAAKGLPVRSRAVQVATRLGAFAGALVLDAAQKPSGNVLDVDVALDNVEDGEGVSGDVAREMRAQVEGAARRGRDPSRRKYGGKDAYRARQLLNLLVELGPAFVKVGQALSSRPDLVPPAYIDALSRLQDRMPSFPHEVAMQVIEEDLGRKVEDVFVDMPRRPVAAASLGQVYKAKLRSNGHTVAVKVQRPGMAESIAMDMYLVREAAAWIDENLEKVGGIVLEQQLAPLVEEFAARLFGELDYEQEADNAEKFERLYGTLPRIRVPKVYRECLSTRVLVTEWIDGSKLTDKKAMEARSLSVVDFVDVGIECTLRQLLDHGYFHAGKCDRLPLRPLWCNSGVQKD